MWKKLSKILMAAIILLSTGFIIPFQEASANVVVSTLAKPVVRALTEKAGMQLTTRQLDNAVSVINQKAMTGDAKALQFVEGTKTLTSAGAGKTGFQKYVLEPALWLSGLDLVFDVVDLFTKEEPVQQYVYFGDKCGISAVVNGSDTTGYTVSYYYNSQYLGSESYPNGTHKPVDFEITFQSETQVKLYTIIYYNPDGKLYPQTQNVLTYSPTGGFVCKTGETVETVPTADDVIDVSKVSPSLKQSFDNDTYDNDTTYNMEIEMPDNVTTYNYDNDTTVWNDVDPEMELEVIPVVPADPDNDDGNGDSIDVLVRVDDEIPIHEKFFLEMADMGQKVEDMYNGVVHFFDVTIDGFTTLTDGMTGFVAFLDDFFDWLPAEYVALLGSGFTLGVVSFFLRR